MQNAKLEKIIKHSFKNKGLLKEALTHRSYLNENPKWKFAHNERLEFLGDAVLELVVTEELFNRYPNKPEGQLTPLRAALVNYQSLAKIAHEIDLENHILLSRGEAKDVGRAREAILADAVEAVIGAIYLDGDYAMAKKFINSFVLALLDEVLKNNAYQDAKSLLQEKIQAKEKLTPTYQVIKEEGPEHKKQFKVGVYFGDRLITTGEGYSKQEAETEAAKKALKKI